MPLEYFFVILWPKAFYWNRANSLSVQHRNSTITQDKHDKTKAASSSPSGHECWRYSAVSCQGVESLML